MNSNAHNLWHKHDGLLTFTDTGDQWQIPDWTETVYELFVTSDTDIQLEILDGLEEWVS